MFQMKIQLILIMWLVQLRGTTTESQQLRPVRIYTNQGLALELKGVAGLSAYTTPISVFIKMQKPNIQQVDQHCDKLCNSKDLLKLAAQSCMRTVVGNTTSLTKIAKIPNTEKCMNLCLDNPECKSFVYVPYYKECSLKSEFSKATSSRKYTVYEFEMDCVNKLSQNCHNAPASQLSQIITSSLETRISKFWRKKVNQFQYLDLHYGESTHVKRQALALLAVPVIGSVLNFGYSWWEGHKLKDKISHMQGKFDEFTHKIYDFEERTVKWEYEALNLIEKLETKITTTINELQCETNVLGYAIVQTQEIDQWEQKINEILRPLESGTKTGPISPEIFDFGMLNTIIRSAKELLGTVYEQEASYLYHTATSTLVAVTDNDIDLSFHIILQIPIIKTDQVYPYYAVRQTSITVNDKCYYHDVPEYVYSVNNSYVDLDLNLCEGGSTELLYCYQNLVSERKSDENKVKAACLNNNLLPQCQLTPTNCTDRTVVLKTGLLIHSDHVVKAIYRKPIDNIKVLEIYPEETKTRVSYYPWDSFEAVEFKNGIVSSPEDVPEIEFDIETETTLSWENMVARNQIQIDKLNTTKAFNELKKSLNKIHEGTLIHKYFGWNKIYISMTVISAAFWSLILAYGIYKMLKNKSSTTKLINFVRPRKSKEKLCMKDLDVEGMKINKIIEAETTAVVSTTADSSTMAETTLKRRVKTIPDTSEEEDDFD